MSNTVIYVGDFKSKLMDAQCQLVIGNCMILRELGYDVVLIGNDSSAATPNPLDSKQIIEGFDVYNIAFSRSVKGVSKVFSNNRKIEKILQKYDAPQFMFFYGSPGFAVQLDLLYRWCRKNNVKVVYNCVDISSQAHGTKFERVAKRTDKIIKEKFITKKADGILAVSEYIRDYYYKRQAKPITIIPPLKDYNPQPLRDNSHSEKVNIVYMGIPFPTDGRIVDEEAYKDRIDLFIDLLLSIKESTRDFCFNLYGLTEEQYVRTVKRHKEAIASNRDIIKFHGRIPYEESINKLIEADYSVVYRSRNQMTMAGFSSKLVESIWCGTPVIMTDTSDYKKYLKNGEMCHIVNYQNPSQARRQLINAINKSADDIQRMKRKCYESNCFYYGNFVKNMTELLVSL